MRVARVDLLSKRWFNHGKGGGKGGKGRGEEERGGQIQVCIIHSCVWSLDVVGLSFLTSRARKKSSWVGDLPQVYRLHENLVPCTNVPW